MISETQHTFDRASTYAQNPLQTQQWYHIVITWQPNKQTIYVDTIKEAENTTVAVADSIPNNPQPLRIGYEPDSANGYFNGIIQEVRIYDRPLTENEIRQLYQQ